MLAHMAARTTGTPPSANGASSFHLNWMLPGEFDAVSVTLEVLETPSVPRLYFWALQADMAGPAGRAGGAHLGLQWHPQYPGSTAVNWGGYHATGGELHGSDSILPSTLGNPNTRDLAWSPGHPHRLRIERVDDARIPEGWVAWRGSVEDLVDGGRVVVRDLYMPGDRIVSVTMWSEVFARCDDPSVAVRWSHPVAETDRGVEVPMAWAVNYQTHAAGGCANTDSSTDEVGAVQRTAVRRSTPQGTHLRVPTID
jgi:hypothetical protein